jgi:hypothetical protein
MRYFENQNQLDQAKSQAESFNVLRRIDHDGRFKPWSDMPGSDVGLVRVGLVRNLALYFLANADHSLGILLVDPTITHGFLLWSGYGDFQPPHPPALIPLVNMLILASAKSSGKLDIASRIFTLKILTTL